MSDNNADFNGTGQVNNPTSDNAAQADYNQPYIPQQNDAQMNHPESPPYRRCVNGLLEFL